MTLLTNSRVGLRLALGEKAGKMLLELTWLDLEKLSETDFSLLDEEESMPRPLSRGFIADCPFLRTLSQESQVSGKW